MLELKIRGYVTPEDFEGTDTERIQKALACAKKEDIRKVVLSGTYKADAPITVPDGMHIIFDNAVLHGDLQNEIINNYSFESDRIYIEGKSGELVGNIRFCHTRHVVLENLKISGNIDFEFSRDLRAEHIEITGKITLGRGCQHVIIQHITCGSVLMSGENKGYDIMGREPIIKNILLRASEITDGAVLKASEDCGFLNIQIDGIRSQKTCITVGAEGETLPAEQYQNLTFADIDAPVKVLFHNEHRHVYTN